MERWKGRRRARGPDISVVPSSPSSPSSPSLSIPPPQCPDEIVQHQKLLVQNHALPLLAELGEEVPEAAAAGDVEAEGLGEILLRMLGGVGADVVAGRDGDAPALEVDPGVVHPAVGLVHLTEGAAEGAGPGPVPV